MNNVKFAIANRISTIWSKSDIEWLLIFNILFKTSHICLFIKTIDNANISSKFIS